MYRGVNCPGSILLGKIVAGFTSTYAQEGTTGHYLAKQMINAEIEGKPLPDTDDYEPDLVELVEDYVDHAIQLRQPGCVQMVEERLSLASVRGAYGTLDLATYYPAQRLLVITDLKLGGGVLVQVKRNLQLMYYALLALLKLNKPVHKVRLEIFQPRSWTGEPLSTWETDIFDVLDFEKEIADFAAKALDPNAPLNVGDWCRFCPAMPICPKLKLIAKGIVTKEHLPINFYTPGEISELLKREPQVKEFFRRLNEFAYSEMMAGCKIPDWKMVNKMGRSKWKDEAPAAMKLNKLPGTAFKPQRLIGIKEFKKKFPDYKNLADQLTDKGSSGFTIVPTTSDRAEAKIGVDFQTAFGSADEIDPLS